MEAEIMQSVLNEVLEELKEVKLQQLEQTKSLTQLTNNKPTCLSCKN